MTDTRPTPAAIKKRTDGLVKTEKRWPILQLKGERGFLCIPKKDLVEIDGYKVYVEELFRRKTKEGFTVETINEFEQDHVNVRWERPRWGALWKVS